MIGRTASIVRSMIELIRRGNLRGFLALAAEAEPADLGEVLSSLDDEQRLEVVQAMPAELSGAALVEMADESQAEETLGSLAEMAPGRAGDIIEGLLKAYAWLEREDVLACLAYARRVVGHERVQPRIVDKAA